GDESERCQYHNDPPAADTTGDYRRAGAVVARGVLVGAADRDRQGAADGSHSVRVQPADIADEARALHGLPGAAVHGGIVLQAGPDPEADLAGRPAYRGRDGRDHHRVEKRNDLLPAEHQHRTQLVGSLEPIAPDLPVVYLSGHEPSVSQPANSAPRAAPSPP